MKFHPDLDHLVELRGEIVGALQFHILTKMDTLTDMHQAAGDAHMSSAYPWWQGPGHPSPSAMGEIDFKYLDGSHIVYQVVAHYAEWGNPKYRTSVKKLFHNSEDYWEEQIAHYDDRTVIVDSVHHKIGDSNMRGERGFGGRKFVVEFFDGRVVESTNMWHQGVIPPVFRDRLKDNAIFRERVSPVFQDVD